LPGFFIFKEKSLIDILGTDLASFDVLVMWLFGLEWY
jgi:hypothetical protein